MILKTLSDWFKTSLGSLVLHLVTADVAQIKGKLCLLGDKLKLKKGRDREFTGQI